MTQDPEAPPDEADVSAPPGDRRGGGRQPLLQAGRYAWAAVGILALVVVAGIAASRLTLVVVPLVIALFPAALLAPVAGALRRLGLPAALAALGTIIGFLALLAGVVALLVPVVAGELPELTDSFGQGVERLLEQAPLDVGGVDELLQRARELLSDTGQHLGSALDAAAAVFEGVTGLLFGVVALFFYLKDGERIANGIRHTFPARAQDHVGEMGRRVWYTLGAYFRGQLLIAFVDAVLIGIGLLLVGIPLAIPLAVLIFFGALFPIVGAVVSGAVAVLVALADGGVTTALIVAAIVIGVQQLEGNVLQPFVLSHAIELHPLMVLAAITAGAVTLGVLGAFLAVPVAASIARVVDYLRGLDGEEEGGDDAGGESVDATERSS